MNFLTPDQWADIHEEVAADLRWRHILAQLTTLQWLIHVDTLAATGKGKR